MKNEIIITTEAVRNRDVSIQEAKNVFDKNQAIIDGPQISMSTFNKTIKKEKKYKRPQNLTDVCLKLKKEIISFSKDNLEFNEEFCSDQYLSFFEKIKNEQMTLIVKQLKLIEFHKASAVRQKETYNRYRTDPVFLGDNAILIDEDYKQKIYYGKKSPRQLTEKFYSYGSCSLLGFGIYYTEHRLNKITSTNEKFTNCLNIDILCENTSQTAADFIDSFRFLRTLDIFKKVEKKKYIIFSDTAKNFRNGVVCHFYLKELALEDIEVSVNFYGEHDGKVLTGKLTGKRGFAVRTL